MSHKITNPPWAWSLEYREWDTKQFEWPVGRITAPDLSDYDLALHLSYAQQVGYQLIYWPTFADRNPTEQLLKEWGGCIVDRKTTFVKKLDQNYVLNQNAQELRVEEYPWEEVKPELRDLSRAAGIQSRFAVDPRFPRSKFEALYDIWITRSTKHELASVVLVACETSPAEPLGVVTISQHDCIGQIDLIAVNATERGRGLGSLLIHGADKWMREHACTHARVVTQRDNEPACRLYERHGYQIDKLENYYHFWVQAGTRSKSLLSHTSQSESFSQSIRIEPHVRVA